MTDAELDDLIREACIHGIHRTVKFLLRGNDAGCFSTEQYAAAWRRVVNKGHDTLMPPELARKHLTCFTRLVEEVRPDVWAAIKWRHG